VQSCVQRGRFNHRSQRGWHGSSNPTSIAARYSTQVAPFPAFHERVRAAEPVLANIRVGVLVRWVHEQRDARIIAQARGAGDQRDIRLGHPAIPEREPSGPRVANTASAIRRVPFCCANPADLILLVSHALTAGPCSLHRRRAQRRAGSGVLRVTFDPRIMTWNDQFTGAGRMKLGLRSRETRWRPATSRSGTARAERASRERSLELRSEPRADS